MANQASNRVIGLACTLALIAGCAGHRGLEPRLQDNDPHVRVRAIQAVVRSDRNDLLPVLVDRLEDEDPAVRYFAIAGLEKMTGQRLGYEPHASTLERREAVTAWRRYLEGSGRGDAGAMEAARPGNAGKAAAPRDSGDASARPGASKP